MIEKRETEFPQELSRFKVTTHDPTTGASLETTRNYTATSARAAINSESEIHGRHGSVSEEARLAHIRALKTKWPDLTEEILATTIAARHARETEEQRLAFVRRALRHAKSY